MLLTDPNNPAHWGNPTGFMVGTPQDMASVTSVPIPQVGDPRVATSVPFPHVSPEFARHIPGIFAGESGGDYDALFGFSNRPGGRYNNVRLTDMTVAEALEFANPRGDYGQWVAGQVGRVATPMGAYQVVGTTLRAAMEGLGLTGNERMTPELQDRIGQWIYENQGIGAWEGYRAGVTDLPTPPANARATSQGGQPMQQPGLLGTMSTMNQQPRDPSIWDALVGRLPERAQGIAGRTIGDADWRDRMAIGLAGMSMRPNEALIDTLQGRMDDRSQERRINQTVQWLQSIGRTDLAEAVAAGSLMGDQAAAIALQPAPTQEPTALMQNYEFLLAQGYAPQDALAALNAGTVVNVGGDAGPQVGTIPPGAALVADPSHPSGYRIEAIPGGPLAAEREAAEGEALAAETRAALNEEVTGRAANVVIQDIGRLTNLIENAPWYNPAVGAGSGLLEGLRGTNAADARALAVTIRANIGFDRLQQMRDSSPTGGALGQVAVQELEALQGVLGSLDTAQSEAQFLQNLNRLNTIYTDIMRKFAAYPNAAEFGITMPEGSIGVSTLPPSGVRTYNPATGQLE
jgi:hypothetical protein